MTTLRKMFDETKYCFEYRKNVATRPSEMEILYEDLTDAKHYCVDKVNNALQMTLGEHLTLYTKQCRLFTSIVYDILHKEVSLYVSR